MSVLGSILVNVMRPLQKNFEVAAYFKPYRRKSYFTSSYSASATLLASPEEVLLGAPSFPGACCVL